MFKVVIAGSRSFNDYEKLKSFCDSVLSNKEDVEIVSGCCIRGADRFGELYAKEKNFCLTLFPADWGKYNKSAGVIRNKEMADYADALIVFWDGVSKGTENMIKMAEKKNLSIKVCRV